MTQLDPKVEAVNKTLEAQRHAGATEAFFRSETQDVFGGVLYTVVWKSAKDPDQLFENLVFDDGKRLHHFNNASEATRFLSQRQPRNPFIALVRELLTVGGAPAVIAIAITITICWLSLAPSPNGKGIPEILGHALTTILGFYFGSKVTGKTGSSHESSTGGASHNSSHASN